MQQYTVTGMSCAACSARVEKAVSKVEGVSACSVSLLTNSMGVEGTASVQEIIAAVERAGCILHIVVVLHIGEFLNGFQILIRNTRCQLDTNKSKTSLFRPTLTQLILKSRANLSGMESEFIIPDTLLCIISQYGAQCIQKFRS